MPWRRTAGQGTHRRPGSLRIVYATPHYHPVVGGAEGHVQALAERMAARGHEVSVFTLRTSDAYSGRVDASLPEEEHVGAVKVVRFAPDERLRSRLNRFLERRGAWRLTRAVLSVDHIRTLSEGPLLTDHLRRVLRSRPDVITTVNWEFAAFALPFYLARRLLRVPLAGMPLLHTEMGWTASVVTRHMIARSDAILANTEHEARFCASRGCPPDRTHVCGSGTDPAAVSRRDGRRLRARHRLGEGPVVAYVGRMQADKGVPLLIEAMRAVWTVDTRARLLLAGRAQPAGSPDDRAFRAALAALDPDERARVVHIDGFPAEDKASIFDACDVYAMPSTTDSFGQTYLEAWLCGRPVIGARIPAIECVIDHGVDGLLVAPRSASAIADALIALLADPERRDRMAAAGREKTLARFTWDRVTDRVEAAYRATVGRTRRWLRRGG